ncbi:MAG: alpha/beta hydrolase [Pseudomonadota bacterium]
MTINDEGPRTDAGRVAYADANGLRLAYETFGDHDAPAVLLIHGWATQMLAWPEPLCRAIAANGYHVIRFDNRDIGLSTCLDHLGSPSITWHAVTSWLGLGARAPYGLDDMARDALELLAALDLDEAHVVGASMGGMIVQHMAALDPRRVLSLTAIMSSSGAPGLPDADDDVTALMQQMPDDASPDGLLRHGMAIWRRIAGPVYPPDEAALVALMRTSAARCPPGGANEIRQLAAIMADGSRVDLLRGLMVPTLVIHGDADPLVPLPCGEDIARHVPGARLEVIPGMGHDLPVALTDAFCAMLTAHFRQADGDGPP